VHDLASLLDRMHVTPCQLPAALAGPERQRVETLLREHQRVIRPWLAEVWAPVQAWVASSPEPLAVAVPGPSGPVLVPLGAPHLPLQASKRASQDVVAFHVLSWVRERRHEPRLAESEAVLARVRALVGVGPLATLSTAGILIEGFVTGLTVGWNLRAVALELCLQRREPARAAAALRDVEASVLALQQALASCRKDVFIQLVERLSVDPEDRTAPWRAGSFALSDGVLHLRPSALSGLGAAPWSLPRQGCPARGRLLAEVDGWVARAWARYVLEPLSRA